MRKLSKLKSDNPVSSVTRKDEIEEEIPQEKPEKTVKVEETKEKAKKIVKKKVRKVRSDMAKHLDRVLAVSVISLVLLAIIYRLEQRNQILEKIRNFAEAKLPFIFG